MPVSIHDDWDDYRLFAYIARAGSLGGAAKVLRRTRQSISMRLDSLEDRIGQRLVLRNSQGVELTKHGKRIMSLVEAAEAHLSRVPAVADTTGPVEGECRLALGDGMGTYWFPRFMATFGRLHPRIELRALTSTRRVIDKTPSHDILVQYSDKVSEDLIAPKVATLHFMLFASDKYLKEYGTPQSIKDLAEHRIVDTTLPDEERGMFAALSGFSDRTVLMANAVATQCEAIRWGTGIGLLPSYAGFVHDGLVPIIPDCCYAFPVHLCYEREAAKRQEVRATIDFLKDVVFDRERMPWFADHFIPPQDNWPSIMRACIERTDALLGLPEAA